MTALKLDGTMMGVYRRSAALTGLMILMLFPDPSAMGQIGEMSVFEKRPEGENAVAWHVYDPRDATALIQRQLDEGGDRVKASDRKFAESVVVRLARLELPQQIELSLEDAVHRALSNSFAVRVQSYNPAVNTAAIVQAEAAFDGTFFSQMTKNKRNAPAPSQLVGTNSDTFSLTGGIRKPLVSGGQITAQVDFGRTETDNQFQTINPVFTNAWVFEYAQPLLRGAGIDFSRSQIEISRNDYRISQHAFRRQVRETLSGVEQAFWRLVQARREVLIRARLLSEFEKIYDYLWQRRDFDIFQIQLSQTKASLESSKADFIQVLLQVRDAEDALLALINDPELNLADDIEIIPVDFPSLILSEVDRIGAVQEALEHRAEIAEARLAIDNAALTVGQAKNQAQPRFDALFRVTSSGLGTSADAGFDQSTQNNFIDYFIFLDLEVPIGNRGRKAALRQSRLRHAQSIAALKARVEQVILEVNSAARAVTTRFEKIDPSLESAQANEDQVASVIARAERKDFTALNQELNARSSLATSRSTLLQNLIEYNIALVELERTKGTLLDYNNVELMDAPD
jgi:outer membrane protein